MRAVRRSPSEHREPPAARRTPTGMKLLIEHKDRHEVRNTGRRLLRTLNVYVPPAYTKRGDELPAGKR